MDDGVFELDRGNRDGVSEEVKTEIEVLDRGKDWSGVCGGGTVKAVIDSLDGEGRKLVESLDWVMKAAELLMNDGGCSGGDEIVAIAESLGLRFKDDLAYAGLGAVRDSREVSSRQGEERLLVGDSGLNHKAVGSSSSLQGAEVSYDSIIQDFFSQPRYKIPITEERGINGKDDINDEQINNTNISKGGVSENNGAKSNGVGMVVDLNTYININGKSGLGKGNISEEIMVEGKPADVGNGNEDILAGAHEENREAPKDIGKKKPNQMAPTSAFSVSDMVWGKIRSHPWWPGQIFDPSEASENSMNYFNQNGLLVAYFGDGTFAWNESSKLKPFGAHFAHLEKQTNLEAFHHAVDCALDEVVKRVEFGLSCPCLSEGLNANLNSQIIRNSGVCTKSRRRDATDEYSSATSFKPVKLVEYIKGLAKTSYGVDDKLEHVIAQAQLLSLYRWKGYPQLAEFKMLDVFLETGTDILYTRKKRRQSDLMDDFVPDFMVVEQHDSSRKRRIGSGDNISFGKSKKSISNFMAPNFGSRNGVSIPILKYGYVSTQKVTVKNESKKRPDMANKLKREKDTIPFDWSSSSSGEMLTLMCLVALNPLEGSIFDNSMISFFSEFRNSVCLNHPGSTKQKLCPEEETNEKLVKKLVNAEITVLSSEKLVKNSSWTDMMLQRKPYDQLLSGDQKTDCGKSSGKESVNAEIMMLSSEELVKNSAWTDMMVQGRPYDQLLSDDQKTDCGKSSGKELVNAEIMTLSSEEYLKDSYWTDMGIEGKPEDQLLSNDQKTDGGTVAVDQIDENGKEESSPTALILNFTNADSVPSITNLNNIFSVYGPLIESKTEIMKKRSGARVVFEYHSDAETAFSSAGKYSTFGPSLVSYRLKYFPCTKKKSSSTPKRRRKTTRQGDTS